LAQLQPLKITSDDDTVIQEQHVLLDCGSSILSVVSAVAAVSLAGLSERRILSFK
jgi:hypothetical protein